jgi:hypothetical protein
MDPVLGRTAVLIAVAFVAYCLMRAARPRPVFAVRVVGGEPRAVVGTATNGFLLRVREVAAEHRVASGWVAGVPRAGGRIALTFSGFPPAARQQLRNWWAASGWSLPKRR